MAEQITKRARAGNHLKLWLRFSQHEATKTVVV